MIQNILGMIKRYINRIKGGLDVILIGETHVDLEQAYTIVEIIEKHKPEYVLYEGFHKENIPIFLNREEEIGLSLKEICERHGASPKSLGFTERVLNKEKLRKSIWDSIRHIDSDEIYREMYLYYTYIDLKYLPNTYEEILNRPLATYHPAILDYFLEIVKKKSGELEGVLLNEKYDNGDLEELLINECTLDLDALGNIDHFHRSNLSDLYFILQCAKFISKGFRESLYDLKPRYYIILSAVYKIGAKIGECDLDLEEKCKILKDYTNGKISWEELHESREKAMADSIEKYVKKRKTDTPIIAIIGRGHLNNVAKLLDDKGINYKMIELEDSIKDPELREYMGCMHSTYIISKYINRRELV